MKNRQAGQKRCSKCKQYTFSATKRKGAVYCDSCLSAIERTYSGEQPDLAAEAMAGIAALAMHRHRRTRIEVSGEPKTDLEEGGGDA